jgi:hypothetical protein
MIKEIAEFLAPYLNKSMVSWLIMVGGVAVVLFYAAYQCERARKR